MTPKEKAAVLFLTMYAKVSGIPIQSVKIVLINFSDSHAKTAKQCALIAVDEIINNNNHISNFSVQKSMIQGNNNYWEEVKQEIEKL